MVRTIKSTISTMMMIIRNLNIQVGKKYKFHDQWGTDDRLDKIMVIMVRISRFKN